MKQIVNLRNAHGYEQYLPGTMIEGGGPFEFDAHVIMQAVADEGNCLIEAPVGAGKSHLMRDIGRVARSAQYELPTLHFSAHISRGSKRGAENARRVVTDFCDEAGTGGVILLDNADMYGYSGSKGNNYNRALAHLPIAKMFAEIVRDDQAPAVCATSHDAKWREGHWRYGERKGDDEVTPSASDLLRSFTLKHLFYGVIGHDTARAMLDEKLASPEMIDGVVDRMRSRNGSLLYRVIKNIDPENVAYDIDYELERIEKGAELLTSGLRSQNSAVLA